MTLHFTVSGVLSESMGSGCVYLVGLCAHLVNSLLHFSLGSVMEVDSSLDAEVVTGHHARLSTLAFSNNEGELWVGGFDRHIVVGNELPTKEEEWVNSLKSITAALT